MSLADDTLRSELLAEERKPQHLKSKAKISRLRRLIRCRMEWAASQEIIQTPGEAVEFVSSTNSLGQATGRKRLYSGFNHGERRS